MDSARARAEKGAPRKLKRLAMSRAVWLTLTLAGGALVWEVLLSGCTSRLRLLYALRTAVGVGTWRGSPRTVKGLLAPSLRQRLCPRRAPPSSASQASIKFASSYQRRQSSDFGGHARACGTHAPRRWTPSQSLARVRRNRRSSPMFELCYVRNNRRHARRRRHQCSNHG